MRIPTLIALLMVQAVTAFSQTLQWDQATALARPEDQLVNSVVTRLILSREVAWSKFCTHAKVRDLAREAKVLSELKEAGRAIGLSPEEVSFFFKPQIVASCRYQEELIEGWANGQPCPGSPPKDLAGEIRPLLDKVDQTLLQQWKAISSKSFDRVDFYTAVQMIQERGIPADVAKIAARPLVPRSSP